MWADADTAVDYLNFSEVGELVAELVGSERMLPLSLGVFGTWGTGKSSILRLAQKELAKQKDKFLFIEFDAWLYQDFDDARAALMSVIAKALMDEAPEGVLEKAKSLYARTNKLRAIGLLAEGGAALFGLPTFGLLSKGIESAGDVLAGSADEEDLNTLKDAAGDAKKKTEGLIAPKEKKSPPEEIGAFRKEFGEVLTGINRTLVVVIDNIDRCTPANAIHTLEAIRLFLFLPRTAFVIAADEDMVRHSVSSHFRNPSERIIQDYLDKLIQVPIRVPRLGVQEVRAYLLLLFADAYGADSAKLEALRTYLIEQLRQVWKPDASFGVEEALSILKPDDPDKMRATLQLADRMAPLLAYSANVKGNPRIIKRMLNVVRMRASIARKRSMPLDESVIAKLVLFERCTASTAVDELHNVINAEGGKPEFLAKLESGELGQAEFDAACPEHIRPHAPFIRDWIALEPRLTGVDLRPAVYLARETVPLRAVAATMSPAAMKAVEVLRVVKTAASPAAREALGAVDATEHVPMMETLVRDMRLNADWKTARDDFRGATMLADTSPPAGRVLMTFVRSLSLAKQPPWMSLMLKDKAWARS